jgi:hypothetical protein
MADGTSDRVARVLGVVTYVFLALSALPMLILVAGLVASSDKTCEPGAPPPPVVGAMLMVVAAWAVPTAASVALLRVGRLALWKRVVAGLLAVSACLLALVMLVGMSFALMC